MKVRVCAKDDMGVPCFLGVNAEWLWLTQNYVIVLVSSETKSKTSSFVELLLHKYFSV